MDQPDWLGSSINEGGARGGEGRGAVKFCCEGLRHEEGGGGSSRRRKIEVINWRRKKRPTGVLRKPLNILYRC